MVFSAGIKGSRWNVVIGGFRGVDVSDVDELLHRVGEAVSPHIFQVFDADRVAGWEHLFFSAVNAVKAFQAGAAVSKSLAVEVLLYASCRDQISQAFSIMGISPSTRRAALLLMGETCELVNQVFLRASGLLGAPDDSVLGVDDKKFDEMRRIFSISDLELEAVGGPREDALLSLIIERGALLPVHR
jgi:KEOPS complex subunit Cgi121